MKQAIDIVLRPELPGDVESLAFRREAVRLAIEQPSDESTGVIGRRELVRALAHRDDEIRHGVAVFAARLGLSAKYAKRALTALLDDHNPAIRFQAVLSLRAAGLEDQARTLLVLLDLLKASDPTIRFRAIEHLRLYRPAPTEVLIAAVRLLADTDNSVAVAAADTLASFGPMAWLMSYEVFPYAKMEGKDVASRRLKRAARIALGKMLGQDITEFDINSYKCFIDCLGAINRRGEELAEIEQPGKDTAFAELMRAAGERTHALRQALAVEIAPALNATIQAMPQETLEEKKDLARWVNDSVKPLGLAVKCPKTGQPSKLWGVKGSYRPGIEGSFAFEIERDGKRVKTAQSDVLPELSLTDSTPSLGKPSWQEVVGPPETRLGRKLS